MSIVISLKQGDEQRDVTIPTEWKDMTLEYWCGMTTIIKSHFDRAKLRRNSKMKSKKKLTIL